MKLLYLQIHYYLPCTSSFQQLSHPHLQKNIVNDVINIIVFFNHVLRDVMFCVRVRLTCEYVYQFPWDEITLYPNRFQLVVDV